MLLLRVYAHQTQQAIAQRAPPLMLWTAACPTAPAGRGLTGQTAASPATTAAALDPAQATWRPLMAMWDAPAGPAPPGRAPTMGARPISTAASSAASAALRSAPLGSLIPVPRAQSAQSAQWGGTLPLLAPLRALPVPWVRTATQPAWAQPPAADSAQLGSTAQTPAPQQWFAQWGATAPLAAARQSLVPAMAASHLASPNQTFCGAMLA